jgi:predicted TIM-barrel fold metal-dependent hydrolase
MPINHTVKTDPVLGVSVASGWFSNNALKYVIKIMGIDRIMFSIDYPYESQYLASDWIDNVPLSLENKEKIAYKNAAKLLKL